MQTTKTTAAQPATRISAAFATAQQEKRGVLIPYFMCGYPTTQQSIAIIQAAAAAGADIIELGMPFSDPLADGPTIQHADYIAIERGMTMRGCMDVARQVAAHSSVPLILMGYYNPILTYGLQRFCQDAASNGVCGLIIPDLPPGLALIFLIPPTTPDERIPQIVERAAHIPGSFIYCVSLSGVTGVRNTLPEHLPSFLARVQYVTRQHHIPIAVGFGLSKPEHIATITRLVEGAVVGSALVKLLDESAEDQQVEAVRAYVHALHEATKQA
jgi:tryptophan synthase alpha chain